MTEQFYHRSASGQGGGVVIMNKLDYNNKLLDLINDVSKFTLCDSKQSYKVKVKINKIASNLRMFHASHFYKIRRKDDYYNGHLYRLRKVHKNIDDLPPLKPFISMSGTVTHQVAQHINSIIQLYINTTYVLRSSNELLLQIKDLSVRRGKQLVSLDV